MKYIIFHLMFLGFFADISGNKIFIYLLWYVSSTLLCCSVWACFPWSGKICQPCFSQIFWTWLNSKSRLITYLWNCWQRFDKSVSLAILHRKFVLLVKALVANWGWLTMFFFLLFQFWQLRPRKLAQYWKTTRKALVSKTSVFYRLNTKQNETKLLEVKMSKVVANVCN